MTTHRSIEARDLLATRLEKWVPDDELYDVVDELLRALSDGGWTVTDTAWIDELCDAKQAALAVAGAELDGKDQERAWTNFEQTMESAHGERWIDAAAMALADLRKQKP